VTLRINSLDRTVIESVLGMGEGYVLDFTDKTFSEFFQEFEVRIDDVAFRQDGDSKAKRLRAFLRIADAPVVASVLGALLQRRRIVGPNGLKSSEIEHYEALVTRLGGAPRGSTSVGPADTETELLRRVFQPELFARLPVDVTMSRALVSRMEEAHRCIDANAHLAAVILCGSVLEGMCLGFGGSYPERVNRGYSALYKKPPPHFHEWKMKEWIDVLGRLGDLSPNVEKFGQALRDFRNYVHPAEQLVHRFSPDKNTARIGFQVVIAAAEDLVRAAASMKASSQ